ncbi:MAG: hypothetical protein JW932_08555 [Deltaproteobacteria bacterium]|nr:hypothetical protein [Deltaproteobacteria bacterium]
MVEERRDSYRFDIQKGEATINHPSTLAMARITNLSVGGGHILVPAGQMDGLGKVPIEFKLGKYPPFQTDVILTRTIQIHDFIHIGTRFSNLTAEKLMILSGFLSDQFLDESRKYPFADSSNPVSIIKKDPDMNCNLFSYHCRFQKTPVYVFDDHSRLPLRLQVRELIKRRNDRHIITNVLDGNAERLVLEKNYLFTFAGTNAAYSFESRIHRIEKSSLSLVFPAYLRQYGFRDSLRVPIEIKEGLEFISEHPRVSDMILRKPVFEVSAQGFSFPFVPEQDLLCPGDNMMNATLTLPDGPIGIKGSIRSIRECSGTLTYGVKILHFSNQEAEMRWKSYVLLATYQRLRMGKRGDAGAYWNILKASDYIGKEVTPTLKTEIKKHFFSQWERHAENPRINQNLIYYKGEKAVGTFSMNLLYPKTGIGHHMSVDRCVRKSFFEIGRELFSGLQYVFRHLVTTEFYISYFYADKTFNNLMFRGFFNEYTLKENYVYDRYHLYKCLLDSEKIHSHGLSNNIHVQPASPELLKVLSEYLKMILPKIEFEAFSYQENEITLETFSSECSAKGYERKRRIFFAVDDDDKPLAALIAETGDIGVNTFNLLNCSWIFYLIPIAKQDDTILASLIKQAMQFYMEEGKPEFIFIDYNDIERQRIERLAVQYFTDGMRWLGNREMLPAYLNYVEETLRMINNHFRAH